MNNGCLLNRRLVLLIIVVALSSCARYPCGSEKSVQRWEKKTRFRSAKYIKNHNADSCTIVRMMAMGKLGG